MHKPATYHGVTAAETVLRDGSTGDVQLRLRHRHADRHTAVTKALLLDLFGPIEQRAFAIRLWTGETIAPLHSSVAPRFTLVLNRPSSLRAMLLPPTELALGEAYLRGDFDVEGDLEAATALAADIRAQLETPRAVVRLIALLLALPAKKDSGKPPHRVGRALLRLKHDRRRDAASVRSHYDVGNDFYSLWLDPRMVYSCAYFPTPETSLADAQSAKLDLICRKLRLQPGEALLDIGCGWGGLVLYAAAKYGVNAVGITLSEEQAAVARERIARARLSDRCNVHVADYRDLRGGATFDKIVSVGMVEHVGPSQLPRYFATAFQLLRPGGLFLNHGIVEAEEYQRDAWSDRIGRVLWRRGEFIDRYVFPDGELVPFGRIASAAEQAGFETRDAEALREHYARTLRHWVMRLTNSWDRAVPMVGEETARTWLLYMAASAQAFASGRLNLIQLLLGKRTGDGAVNIPLTRDDIYAPGDLSSSLVVGSIKLMSRPT